MLDSTDEEHEPAPSGDTIYGFRKCLEPGAQGRSTLDPSICVDQTTLAQLIAAGKLIGYDPLNPDANLEAFYLSAHGELTPARGCDATAAPQARLDCRKMLALTSMLGRYFKAAGQWPRLADAVARAHRGLNGWAEKHAAAVRHYNEGRRDRGCASVQALAANHGAVLAIPCGRPFNLCATVLVCSNAQYTFTSAHSVRLLSYEALVATASASFPELANMMADGGIGGLSAQPSLHLRFVRAEHQTEKPKNVLLSGHPPGWKWFYQAVDREPRFHGTGDVRDRLQRDNWADVIPLDWKNRDGAFMTSAQPIGADRNSRYPGGIVLRPKSVAIGSHYTRSIPAVTATEPGKIDVVGAAGTVEVLLYTTASPIRLGNVVR